MSEGTTKPKADGKSKDSSSISRFFLPAKRKRPVVAEEEAPNKPQDNNNVIDLLEDSESDTEEQVQFSKDSKSIGGVTQASPEFKDLAPEKDTQEVKEGHNAVLDVTTTTTTTGPAQAVSPADSEKGGQGVLPVDASPTESVEESKDVEEDPPEANPFAKFSFGGSSTSSTPVSFASWTNPKVTTKPSANATTTKQTTKAPKAKKSEYIRMKDIAQDEQERIVKKWHSLVDPEASLEDRRFQVLVAARIHARCQEGQVRKAMKELMTYFRENSAVGVLSVESMAAIEDPEVMVPCIRNLQYHNAKAKHLVKAAQEIKSQFRGKVPEDEFSLKQISGIGPVFADLLAFVNTKARHEEVAQREQQN